jgi:hypothetical protein
MLTDLRTAIGRSSPPVAVALGLTGGEVLRIWASGVGITV